jgi:hypothetical protein
MNTSIEFDVKPDWDEIEKIRNKSADFFQSHELSDDTIHSVIERLNGLRSLQLQ